MSDEEHEDKKNTNAFTDWYGVSERLYVLYDSFVSRVSLINILYVTGGVSRMRVPIMGAMRDLYRLYHISMSSKAFPPGFDKEKKDLLRIATAPKLATREELNWASETVQMFFDKSGILSIKIPYKKRYDGSNAMAEGYGAGYR